MLRKLLVALFLTLSLVAPAMMAPAAVAETRLALVIGNGGYSNFPSLRNPPNDAALMATTLREIGFTVIEEIDASQVQMKRAIQDFGRRLEDAGRDTVGLFYFAGHGVQAKGVNYLIPLESEIEREPDLEINAVPLDWVLAQAEAAGNRMNILILDACRDNPLSRSIRSAARGFTAVDAPRGTLIAYATSPGNVALDGTGSNSPYTEALTRAMREPGVVIESAFRNVRVEVMEATGERQVPWENSSLTGEFYFNGNGGRPAPAQVAALTEGPADDAGPSPGRGSQGAEMLYWESIAESTDPALFRDYLRRFPDGMFAAIAKSRLQKLESAGQADRTRTKAQPKPAPRPEPQVAMAPVVREPPRRFQPTDLVGRWEGTYRCQQDVVGLTLDIARSSSGQVSGRFEFFPTGSAPSFPSGSFEVTGSFDAGSNSLRLAAGKWIERPWGKQRHDLAGTVQADGRTIEGRILTTGCNSFTISRR